jgi:hypothetical protein
MRIHFTILAEEVDIAGRGDPRNPVMVRID